ncbi:tumor protein p63-regulated gene 1-like protein [Gigantopelta aegis]|uniref:tumor protein p63-regulated gene 1-like protein n=1 Tax=Gigantopelta aegis TaxID=1735272 RepID=UPI001B88D493|nr:tumor protein p63-regulated gene 1-like protein [Gigantopelta aegis]
MEVGKEASTTVHLDDDKPALEGQFVGATLELNAAEAQKAPDKEPEVGFEGPGSFDRARPGSVIGRQSVASTTSRTSMRPGVVRTDVAAKTYFSYKDTAFEAAVEKCRMHIKPELDGNLTGAWLLTEIDHWDLEHEKICMLTENSLIVCKYNFINQSVIEYKRIMLHCVDTIVIGDFKYPDYSVMPDREHGGIQLRWNRGQDLSFGQKWNPFSTDIPYATFCHHPLIYNPKENETITYNVDDFFESLVQATSKCYDVKRPGEKITIIEGPIVIESYASVTSMIYNQSGIGFFRDRNGVSF